MGTATGAPESGAGTAESGAGPTESGAGPTGVGAASLGADEPGGDEPGAEGSGGTTGTDPGGEPGAEALASWSGRGVGIGDVCAALNDLRHGEALAATRTSVVNLIVAAADHEAAARAQQAMRRLGHRHPGRTLALVCRPDAPEGIDATVELHGTTTDDHAIWWEEVRLEVSGHGCAHLTSLVMPLLLARLPVAVWFPSALPSPGDPLLSLADAVLVDARWAIEAGAGMASLVELSQRHTVVDLSWKRLTPWRRLLAGLFEPTDARPYLAGVTSAEVAANPGPGRLLAGWLIDRVGLAPSAVTLRSAIHASVKVSANHDGHSATFSVVRPSDDLVVFASADIEGRPARSESAALPERGLTWSLAQALARLARDPRYDHAIRSALSLK